MAAIRKNSETATVPTKLNNKQLAKVKKVQTVHNLPTQGEAVAKIIDLHN